jgi:hypothetical protein
VDIGERPRILIPLLRKRSILEAAAVGSTRGPGDVPGDAEKPRQRIDRDIDELARNAALGWLRFWAAYTLP